MDYPMINSGGQNHGGFGKAQEGAPPPHWLSHVQVDDVDETVEKAKAAGRHRSPQARSTWARSAGWRSSKTRRARS